MVLEMPDNTDMILVGKLLLFNSKPMHIAQWPPCDCYRDNFLAQFIRAAALEMFLFQKAATVISRQVANRPSRVTIKF